nr:hypothetical protein Iba_chr04fCG6790 [Ipomoea batatas]
MPSFSSSEFLKASLSISACSSPVAVPFFFTEAQSSATSLHKSMFSPALDNNVILLVFSAIQSTASISTSPLPFVQFKTSKSLVLSLSSCSLGLDFGVMKSDGVGTFKLSFCKNNSECSSSLPAVSLASPTNDSSLSSEIFAE